MSPRRFIRLLRLDLYLLRRHGALTSITIFTVLICLMVMFGVHVIVGEVQTRPELLELGDPFQEMGIPGAEMSWQGMASIALWVRSLPFFIPLILIVLTGRVVANTVRNHTLREELVRPISRTWLLLIRFAALSAYSLLSLVLCLALCFVFGKFLGIDGVYASVSGLSGGQESPTFAAFLMGLGLAWISDMALIAIAMLLSLLIQPTSRVFLILVLSFILDFFARIALSLYVELVRAFDIAEKQANMKDSGGVVIPDLSQLEESDKGKFAEELINWFPGEALDMWKQWPEETWDSSPIVATLVIFGVCMTLAIVRFKRMDIV